MKSSNKVISRGIFVNQDILVVGIDIGKSNHVAVGTSLDSGFTPPYHVSDSRDNYISFEKKMEVWKEEMECKEIVVGFESTGHYWKPIAYYLKGKGYSLVEVSTLSTKRSKEMMDNSPLKSDKKDAIIIADLIKQGKILNPVLPEGEILNLRGVVHTRENLVKERTSILNRLEKIVDITFPERKKVIRKVKNKTSQFLLRAAPFPEDILDKGREWLEKWICKKSHGYYGREDAKTLCNSARDTVGIKGGREGFLCELRVLLPELKRVSEEIEKVEGKIKEMLKDIDEAKYLRSIPGVKFVTAAAIIAESGGLRKYERMRSVIKIAGLNLYEVSSGKHKGEKKITKMGRSLMRQKLYFAALQQTKENMPLYPFYERLVEKNNVKENKALIAVARKLLKVMFALVRDKRFFERDWNNKGLSKVT